MALILFSVPATVVAKDMHTGSSIILASYKIRTSHPSGLSLLTVPLCGISSGLGARAPQKTIGSPSVSMSHGALGNALNGRYPVHRRKRLDQSNIGSRTRRILYSSRERRGDYGDNRCAGN